MNNQSKQNNDMPRLVNGLEQIFTNLGIIGAGYKLFFFETTTTTPKTTYSDSDLQVQNPNPVECDEAGRPEFDIWGADPATYKLILGTPDSVIGNINPIVTIDPIDDLNTDSIINLNPLPAAYWGATTGTSTNYILDALVPITSYSDKQCFFVDFHIACGASPDININDIGAVDLKKYTITGTKLDIATGDIQTGRHILINDGVDIVVLNLIPASETAPGIAEIATQAETNTGSDNLRFITPLKLATKPGLTVQVVNFESGSVATGTTTLPADDTIPQNTEGNEYMSLAITPTNISNKLKIDVVIAVVGNSTDSSLTAALFQDNTISALAAALVSTPATTRSYPVVFSHYMTAGTTSSTTFKVRIGGANAGTTTFNGFNSGRIFGGVAASSITITEIKV